MSCDEISELLPAYVLGALDAEELQAVEAHLRDGREHDEELVELRATVFALDRFGEDLAPDAGPQSISSAAESSRRVRIGRPPVWLEVQGAAGRYLVLDGSSSAETVTVTMAGFDRLSDEQAYQLWAIRDGEWQPIGNCNTNPQGWWRGDFVFTVQAGEQVAVTVEPTGGSSTPTSERIFISGQ